MKSCAVWGDLGADRTDDQYPTVNYCDECFELLSKPDEDGESSIVHETTFDLCHGDTCARCEISYEDEKKNK